MDYLSSFDSLTATEALSSHSVEGPEEALQDLITSSANSEFNSAHVCFVGAGPGDPELLTLKAIKALEKADVIVYDRLVAPEILKLGRRDAIYVDVGKAPGLKGWTQTEINAELLLQATNGAYVVRLKSGDPSLYGRLDEELSALDSGNIPFDIVPGITSALAAAASAKVSLTKRARNSSVRFITGQDTEGYAEHDWQALAKKDSVAVMYMGRQAAAFVQTRLLQHEAVATTPVTIVENASRSNQRIVNATLATLSNTIADENINGPIIVLLGLLSPVKNQNSVSDVAEMLHITATTA